MKPQVLELTRCQFQFKLIVPHVKSSNDTLRTDSKYVINYRLPSFLVYPDWYLLYDNERITMKGLDGY
jgi:hypothetical protein